VLLGLYSICRGILITQFIMTRYVYYLIYVYVILCICSHVWFLWMVGGYLGCHVCRYVVKQFCAAIWCGVAVAFQILGL
jgi:hypothetical protein